MPGTSITFPPGDVGADLLVIEEVAAVTGYSVQGLHTSRYRGLAPGCLAVKWRGRLYWRRSDVQKWLAERFDDDFDRRWSERHRKKGEQITTRARAEFLARKRAAKEES